ncbi:MAG: hypothetical protein GY794_27005 [bacterium]|nr:hypothetical protein [bacterium]
MVHPFEKILSDQETNTSGVPQPSRRHMLKLAAGGAVAVVAGQAFGQVATTMALGEEGGVNRPMPMPTPVPGIVTHIRDFRVALRTGDLEKAAEYLAKIEKASESRGSRNPYKALVAGCRKQLGSALTAKLKRADGDLAKKKLVPAIKGYRLVLRIDGFDQQDQAKAKLTDAEKLEGYKEALSEVQAQELYDTAAKLKDREKLPIYEQIAKKYPQTPTGKKAAKQAKPLSERVKREDAEAEKLLEKARKANGSTQEKMLRDVVRRYPETPAGKIAAQMLPKDTKPVEPTPPDRTRITTMALGEEG